MRLVEFRVNFRLVIPIGYGILPVYSDNKGNTMSKPRSDRNHIIYMITNTVTGEQYIGKAVMLGQAVNKTMKKRWQGHLRTAMIDCKPYLISESIRKYGPDAFAWEVIEIVRGTYEASAREAELINTVGSKLNTLKQNNVQVAPKPIKSTPIPITPSWNMAWLRAKQDEIRKAIMEHGLTLPSILPA